MTPKEALKMIDVIADEIGVWLFDSLAKEGFYLDDLRNHIRNQEQTNNELEALKKPPTADEVCSLIEKDIKGKASYSRGQFYIDNEKVDDILFGVFRAKTLIAIGKFYEEIEK